MSSYGPARICGLFRGGTCQRLCTESCRHGSLLMCATDFSSGIVTRNLGASNALNDAPMSQAGSVASALGSERPVVDPIQDALGYAPFARRIARAVSETPSPEGPVMAVHGPWGSGKSTLLNFVKHEIAALPPAQPPVVIDFNLRWFEAQQNLAAQFLAAAVNFREGSTGGVAPEFDRSPILGGLEQRLSGPQQYVHYLLEHWPQGTPL